MVTGIVAAAGRGRRFGAPDNKVFAPLHGRTVLHWSIDALVRSGVVDALVLVTGAEDLTRVHEAAAAFSAPIQVVAGGAERYDSVWNALQAVPAGTEWVAIHDGARPLVRPELVRDCVAAARESGAALPAYPVSDTLKRSGDGRETVETVERGGLFAVQTPQVFALELLRHAYREARTSGVPGTDDASFIERLGHPVTLVPGDRTNLKVTLPEDLRLAEGWMREESLAPVLDRRTGFGYDVHRLVAGRPLVLGGVALSHPDGVGLEGHSDADVLLHAISDALLGAAALGDIGLHFPNTDERYRGISSLVLLQTVREKLAAAGWRVGNVDAMVVAERPRLRPHVDTMRGHIAGVLGIAVERVNIKATTNERLGFEGREEGIAAHAVATVER
jgi:2-C-methyl-D-erythritol 4-phosphate cytidylyltransferase/2-C-methyl-D-erythritol 2,4-cyclodiphosphate synthase